MSEFDPTHALQFKTWSHFQSNLQEILSRYRASSFEDRLVLRETITNIFSAEANFGRLWSLALLESDFAQCINYLFRVPNIVGNALGNEIESIFCTRDFPRYLLRSAPKECILSVTKEYNRLSNLAKGSIILEICFGEAFGECFSRGISNVAPEDTICVIKRMIEIFADSPISKEADVCFRRIFSHGYHSVSFNLIVDSIIIKPASPSIIPIIVSEIKEKRDLIEALDVVSGIWANKSLLEKGLTKRVEYFFDFLDHFLTGSGPYELLFESGSRKIPIILALSTGVSNYLDSSDRRIREKGIQVGNAISKLLGNGKLLVQSPSKQDALSTMKPAAETPERVDPFESNSEFEAYSLEDQDDSVASSSYLKECYQSRFPSLFAKIYFCSSLLLHLTMLCPVLIAKEDEEQSLEKQRIALTSIPVITNANPPDAKDITPLLTKELIRLANSFNLDHFEDLRRSALESILERFPLCAFPVLIESICSQSDLSIGMKISALESLSSAALNLAKFKSNSLEKGRVKESKNRAHVENEFNKISPYLFYPLLALLQQELINNCSQSCTQSDLESLVSVSVLRALVIITQCSALSIYQSAFVENLFPLVVQLRESPNRTIFQSSLEAGLSLLETMSQTLNTNRNPNTSSALTSGQIRNIMPSIVSYIDWVSKTLSGEADAICRALKFSILSLAVTLVPDV